MKKTVCLTFLFVLLLGITSCATPDVSVGETDNINPSVMPSLSPEPTRSPLEEAPSNVSSKVFPDIFDLEFPDLTGLEFWWGSGAGGWETTIEILPDGTFTGHYVDGELGDIDDDYPEGTVYECYFSGNFTALEKVGDYTYSLKCESLEMEGTIWEEKITDGVRFITSGPNGFDITDFLLYLPGKETNDFSEDLMCWLHYVVNDNILTSYVLVNVEDEIGFFIWP